MGENVSVIIPAYNEEDRIKRTLDSLRAIEGIDEIIVVDDGSTDATLKVLQTLRNIKLLHLDYNKGKGNAVRYALKDVTNRFVALLDADLCESASEVYKLIKYISPDENRLIIGRLPSPIKKGGFGIVRKVSRNCFNLLAAKPPDSLLSGQRIVPLDLLKSIELPDGFGLEFKLTLEGVKRGFKLIEVPVDMRHRETGRNLEGFIHRAKQLRDIVILVKSEMRK